MARPWVLVLALAVALLPVGALGQTPHRVVLGYYVPYDAGSWTTLQAHVGEMDLVAAQWVSIDACGNLTSRDDQTLNAVARASGVGVLPSLLTGSGWLNHHVLADDDAAANAIEQIVGYTLAEDYAGFDLDLEAVDAGDRAAYTRFVGWLADALHDAGKLLTLAIPAKDRDVTVGWAGAYDYAALGAHADLITIMAYEYRGPFSGPGSVAPYDWVDRVARFSTQEIPPEKVLLGLAFYGYDWNSTSGGARAIGHGLAQAIAAAHGAAMDFDERQQSATFAYEAAVDEVPVASPSGPLRAPTGHRITLRQAPPCDLQPPAPARPPSPRPVPPSSEPQQHQVWIEDSTSAAARLGIVERYGAAGVATWRLGLEDPRIWDVFAAWRAP